MDCSSRIGLNLLELCSDRKQEDLRHVLKIFIAPTVDIIAIVVAC